MLEEDRWTRSEEGTVQGGSISPLPANLYLHHALDLWVHHWRRTRARGEVIVVRFEDDLVVGFQYREEARRFWFELEQRLVKFGLELHPEKTCLIEFGRFAAQRRKARGESKPEANKGRSPRVLIFYKRGHQAYYLYLVTIPDILATYLTCAGEGNHMSKSMDKKKTEKKKPQKTAKEKKLAKQEKKRNK